MTAFGFGDTFAMRVKEDAAGHAFIFIGEHALVVAVAFPEALFKVLGVV